MSPNTPPAKTQSNGGFMQRLAELLCLGSEATEDDMIAALKPKLATAAEATPDPRKFVPMEAVAELLQDRNGRIALMNEQAAASMVEQAYEDGHLTPAMRGWATALANQDPESFRTFVAKSPRPYAHLFNRSSATTREQPAQGDESGEAAAICAQLGLKPGSLNSSGGRF